MTWNTCDDCIPVVDRLFALWVRGGNAGGLEALRIQLEREHWACWLKEHRRKSHTRVTVAVGDGSSGLNLSEQP